MSLLQKLFGKKSLTADTGWFGGNWGGPTIAGIPINSVNALQNSVVACCVMIIAEDISKTPLQIYNRTSDGGKKPAKDHFLYRLLKSPNDYMTRLEFLECMVANLALNGNAYAALIFDDKGDCQSMHPVHPDRVGMFEAADGDYYYFVSRNTPHERAMLKQLPERIPSEFMLHLKWLPTQSNLIGNSRVNLAREAVALALSLEESSARLMGNGMKPSALLTTAQKLSKESEESLMQALRGHHGGSHNHGGILPVPPGMKFEPMRMSNVDAEFIESRKYQITEVARYFRMPLHKLGVTDAGSGPSMVQQEQGYFNDVLSSYCDKIVSRIYKTFDIDPDGEYLIEFDYQAFLNVDIATRLTTARVGILGSLYTVNEARQSLGLPAVPGGDVVLQATNLAPLGFDPSETATGEPGSDQSGKPARDGDGDEAAEPRPAISG